MKILNKEEIKSEMPLVSKILEKVTKRFVKSADATARAFTVDDFIKEVLKEAGSNSKTKILNFIGGNDYVFFINTHSADKADADDTLKQIKYGFSDNEGLKTKNVKGVIVKGQFAEDNSDVYAIIIPCSFSIAFTPKE